MKKPKLLWLCKLGIHCWKEKLYLTAFGWVGDRYCVDCHKKQFMSSHDNWEDE